MNNILIIIALVSLITLVISLISNSKQKKELEKRLRPRDFTKINISKMDILKTNSNKYTILVVEDDPVNRKILTKQLASVNYNVVVAENGTAALELVLTDSSIDIILLDIMLPDITGFSVCRRIRENFSPLEKPVIMVTAKNMIEDLIDGFEAGANDFIIKPYNIYELVARINSSLSLKSVSEHNISLTKINQLKSDIIDMAAHDLKSPLTLISGYAKRIIAKLPENQNECDNAKKILNSSNKMLEIVSKLLEDSKYDDYIPVITKEDLVSLLKDSIEFYEDSAKNKNQKIIFEHSDQNFRINIDRQCFITAIENLLTNALKYSPLSSDIIIKLQNQDNFAIISITDKGEGFSNDEMKNLFDKYSFIGNKPTNGEESTGIGLSIVYNMICRMEGKITVDSQKGLGSTFTIHIPME